MHSKLLFFMATSLVAYTSIMAQNIDKPKAISSTYDRSSLTCLYMKFPGENHATEIASKFPQIAFSDKYYNNNLQNLIIEAPYSRTNTEIVPEEAIKDYLTKQKLAKSIISEWYNRKEDGTMSMDLIFERGMFNATDAEYIKAQTTKRGNALLQDYGNRLIQRSYILVFDYANVKTMSEAKVTDRHGWQATVTAYLYKIDFNEEIQAALYDCWIYPEDSPEVKAEKLQKFEQLEIPIEFVAKTTHSLSASQANPNTQLGKLTKQKSDDELLMELVQSGYDETLYYLEKKYEDFMVKATIYKVKPIQVKIGKKEGLKCDHRYFVYEYVFDEKTNSIKPVYRGVIRATSKIADNRQVATGEMPSSTFYQTAGRKLQTGYLVRQQNDIGIEILAGYEMGEIGGPYGRLDFRLGRFIGLRAFFIYLEGGGQQKEYEYYYPSYSWSTTEDVTFLRYGVGLAQGLMLTRNTELRPYIGIGLESASSDEIDNADEGNLSTMYLKFGGNLAINVRHNIQLTGGISYYALIGNAGNKNNSDLGIKWDEIFQDRKGLSGLVGLKIMF